MNFDCWKVFPPFFFFDNDYPQNVLSFVITALSPEHHVVMGFILHSPANVVRWTDTLLSRETYALGLVPRFVWHRWAITSYSYHYCLFHCLIISVYKMSSDFVITTLFPLFHFKEERHAVLGLVENVIRFCYHHTLSIIPLQRRETCCPWLSWKCHKILLSLSPEHHVVMGFILNKPAMVVRWTDTLATGRPPMQREGVGA